MGKFTERVAIFTYTQSTRKLTAIFRSLRVSSVRNIHSDLKVFHKKTVLVKDGCFVIRNFLAKIGCKIVFYEQLHLLLCYQNNSAKIAFCNRYIYVFSLFDQNYGGRFVTCIRCGTNAKSHRVGAESH